MNSEVYDKKGNYLYLACTKYSNQIFLKIGITKNINERMKKNYNK